jgi:Holin of 3TMs, for gene-transfer release
MRASDPLTAVLNIGTSLIDRLWPDPATRDAAKLELLRLNQTGELAELNAAKEVNLGQIAINVEEAKSTNLLVSGWRPFAGWICGAGLGYQFLVYPILVAFVPEIQQSDMGTLLTILLGLLGLGALRTTEKVKGVN